MKLLAKDSAGILRVLRDVARHAGKRILASRGGELQDTHDLRGHESSVIDDVARSAVEAGLRKYWPEFKGRLFFELDPYLKHDIDDNRHPNLVLIIDELEGTTNTKRCLSSAFEYQPQACVSIALSEANSLKGLRVSAVYLLSEAKVFSAMRIERGYYMSFVEDSRIDPEEVRETRGDSRARVIVAGYSNSHRQKKAKLEEALWQAGIKVYEGCRASAVDLLGVIRNQFDAYIDLRALWSTKKDGVEQEAMLQVYDIAGILPVVLGSGLLVSDAFGNDWEAYEYNSSIPLVVSRGCGYRHKPSDPELQLNDVILDIVKPFAEKWAKEIEDASS